MRGRDHGRCRAPRPELGAYRRTTLALAAVVLSLPAAPASAADWISYHNDRFGYAVSVPGAFAGQGEPDSHDGQVFLGPARARIAVWGGYLAQGDFSAEIARRMSALGAEGWALTYKALTPTWASYSGRKGSRVVYVRAIAGCGGGQYAMAAFEYGAADIVAYKPVVEALVTSLRQERCD